LDLRTSLFHVGAFEQIFDHLREAETLAEALEDQERLARVSDLRAANFNMLGDHGHAVDSSRRAFALASARGIPRLQAAANFHLGAAYYSLGDYRRATAVLRQNVDPLENEQLKGRPDRPSLGSVVSRTWLVWSLAELGTFSEGIAHGTEGLRIAEVVDRPDSLINAYSALGFLYLRQGDLSQAIPLLERGFGLYQDWQIPLLFPLVASALGAAYMLAGRIAEALPHLEQAVAHAASISMMDFQSHRLSCLGEAYFFAGRIDEALATAKRALEISCQHKERGWEAYALRLLGEITGQRHPPAVQEAEEYYHQALVLAEELGMRPLVAHCHLGLGKLYAEIGRRAKARGELSAAIGLYRAMDMTFWLPQAEAALEQVEGR
jgi:tetratricopeptide (TPR) repeat protein